MTFNEHMETFAGLPVVEFDAGNVPEVVDPGGVAWRLSVDYEDEAEVFLAALDALIAAFGPAVTTLVIGQWGTAYEDPPPVEEIVARAGSLPKLEALFVGEMTFEECEVSWIGQDDLSKFLVAFPRITHLSNRGSTGFTAVSSPVLESLVLESGGLPASTVRAVGASDLPALRYLELWLGTEGYGGDSGVDDLAEILGGARLPSLRYLGFRNAEHADAVAAVVAGAPVVARLEVLDLSMGTLGDDGARALLGGQPLTHLRRLDLHRHYLSEEMMARVVAELPGVEVDLSDRQKDDRDRYVSVGE
jgi:hypothetical protein